MAFKMAGFSAFTKKHDKDYEPQTKAGGREYEDKVRRSDLDEEGKKIFDSKGYKPQSQIDPKDIPPPSVKEDKASERAYYDIMPQTEIDKADVDRLEGEITSIFDNKYHEAKEDNDTKAMKRYEKQMLKLKKEIESRGAKDESGVNMSNF